MNEELIAIITEEIIRQLGRKSAGEQTSFACLLKIGSKIWNSTSKYRRVIWQCNSKFKGSTNAKRRIWTRKPLKRSS